MSLTTTCGRISSSSGSSARAASAAWSPSAESGSGGGNMRYSSAAAKPSPAPSTAARRSSQVSIVDLVAAPAQRPPERDRREDVPRVAEGGDQEAQVSPPPVAVMPPTGCRVPRRAG